LTHVDFQAVSMSEKIRAEVSIHLHGVAPAVKEYNAVIVTNMTSLTVEALPQDLPERFELDISGLAEIGNALYVRDIDIPADVEMLSDIDEVIVIATGTAIEEEEVVSEETDETAEPELVEKKKDEEDEE
jgi:large subunit ribosomal protein L25